MRRVRMWCSTADLCRGFPIGVVTGHNSHVSRGRTRPEWWAWLRTLELEFVEDLTPAAWLANGIRGFAENVGSIVPHGFDAYARLFHPASLDGAPVSWGDVARANGKVMHAEAQLEAISGVDPRRAAQPGLWDRRPDLGHLPGTSRHDTHDLATPLVEVLRGGTTTPDRVWFCVWEGWGGLLAPDFDARFQLPSRAYWLLRGPIDAVSGGFACDRRRRAEHLVARRPGVVRGDRDRLPVDVRRRLVRVGRRPRGRPEVRGTPQRNHRRRPDRQ